MAAGMGSRYGGLKQIDGLGPSGEIMLEYAVYDAIKAGFEATLLIDGTRAVEVAPGDGDRTLEELRAAGVKIRKGPPE